MSWAALGGAAISVIGSKLLSPKPKKDKNQNALEQLAIQQQKETSPLALGALRGGIMNMDEFDDYWRRIGRGDRQGALQLLAPQISIMDQQARAAQGADITLGRSGASAERNIASRDGLLAGRNNLLLGLRGQAVDQLGQSAANRANLGANLLSGNQATSLGLLGNFRQQQADEYARARDAASSWAQIGSAVTSGLTGRLNNRRTNAQTRYNTNLNILDMLGKAGM